MNDIRTWFRTRWGAFDWFLRWIFLPLAVLLVVVNVVIGEWVALAAVLAWVYVVSEWQYWQKVGMAVEPLTDFGAVVAKELHAAQERGHRIVTLRRESHGWIVYRDDLPLNLPTIESDPT